jgi:hypothetical protein
MRNLLAICAVVCTTGVAFAQQSQNPMSYEAVAKAKQGAWAEYTMSMKGQAQQIKMRYAVVEKTDKQMGLEIDSNTPMGEMHMMMTFEPAPPDAWKLAKAKMQMGNNPPQDMPAAVMASNGIKKNDQPGKLVGSEKVTVPAGTFDTKRYTRTLPKEAGGSTIDVWMSDKAIPTGLVKMTDARGVEMVLSKTGSDAKARPMSAAGSTGAAGSPAAAGTASGTTEKPAKTDKSSAPAKK